MKVVVDAARCEGNAKCEAVAPEAFSVGDDDLSRVLLDEIPPELVPKVEHAIRVCPRQAIAWSTE